MLLYACKAGGFQAQTTLAVLLESLNTLADFPSESQRRFYQVLVEVKWQFLPVPAAEVMGRYQQYINSKDVHVLAAAVEGRSQFLLTLDRRHILAAIERVKQARLPIVILRPGDFIQQYYPEHEDYPRLPPAHTRQ